MGWKKKTIPDQYDAFIGENAKIEGQLRFSNTVLIDGSFKGEISGSGKLIVGEHGIIESDVNVSDITVYGEIHGGINAKGVVDIRKSGRVYGDVESLEILIEQGAIIEGKCVSSRKKSEVIESKKQLNEFDSAKKQKHQQ